jgi:uridine kinase
MEDIIQVEINGQIREYPKGIRLLDISKEYQKDYKEDIILAFVGNRLRELQKTVQKNCQIRFVTTADSAGHKTYTRGLTLVMLKAIYSVLESENINKVSVEYSIGNGLYCQMDIKIPLTEEKCRQIKEQMQILIDRDIPITKKTIGTDDAIELFVYQNIGAIFTNKWYHNPANSCTTLRFGIRSFL